jgi:hypothetical protein
MPYKGREESIPSLDMQLVKDSLVTAAGAFLLLLAAALAFISGFGVVHFTVPRGIEKLGAVGLVVIAVFPALLVGLAVAYGLLRKYSLTAQNVSFLVTACVSEAALVAIVVTYF